MQIKCCNINFFPPQQTNNHDQPLGTAVHKIIGCVQIFIVGLEIRDLDYTYVAFCDQVACADEDICLCFESFEN
jgi:hypothetical protein